MAAQNKKKFKVRNFQGATFQYSQGAILRKLMVGELSPSDQMLWPDGKWRAIQKTTGFRGFCARLEEKGTRKPAKGVPRLEKPAGRGGEKPSRESKTDREIFQLDEVFDSNPGNQSPASTDFPERGNYGRKVKAKGAVQASPRDAWGQNEPGAIPQGTKTLLPQLPQGKNEDNPEGTASYSLVPERESKLAKKIRRATSASYAPPNEETEWDWVGHFLKLAIWGVMILACLVLGPRLAEWAGQQCEKSQSVVANH